LAWYTANGSEGCAALPFASHVMGPGGYKLGAVEGPICSQLSVADFAQEFAKMTSRADALIACNSLHTR